MSNARWFLDLGRISGVHLLRPLSRPELAGDPVSCPLCRGQVDIDKVAAADRPIWRCRGRHSDSGRVVALPA